MQSFCVMRIFHAKAARRRPHAPPGAGAPVASGPGAADRTAACETATGRDGSR